MPLVRGRAFAETDRAGAPLVAVMSDTAARRLLPGREAVGQRVVIREQTVEVVGVMRDVRANPLTSDSPASIVYVPLSQWPVRTASVVVRALST